MHASSRRRTIGAVAASALVVLAACSSSSKPSAGATPTNGQPSTGTGVTATAPNWPSPTCGVLSVADMSTVSGIRIAKTEQSAADKCGYQTPDQTAGFDAVTVTYYTVAAADEFSVAANQPGAKPVAGVGSKAVAVFDATRGFTITVLLPDNRGFLVTEDRNQTDATQAIAAKIAAAA